MHRAHPQLAYLLDVQRPSTRRRRSRRRDPATGADRVHRDPPQPSGTLHVERLFTDPWSLLLPPDHALCGRADPIGVPELRAERWVAGETFTHVVSALCKGAGFEPDVVHRSTEYAVITTLVSLGHGIAVMPVIEELGRHLPPVVLKRLDISDECEGVLAVLRRTSRRRPAVAAVVRLLRQPWGGPEVGRPRC
ncbi:LysR substrate-binding domain-containing protein [Streptomyces sp. 184]|uniref:LysR substrate-binding domain-containing protein n=1 Tax=Streptomyces sp. 184 TaxID=1827526 RepID=UPI00389247E6